MTVPILHDFILPVVEAHTLYQILKRSKCRWGR